MYHKKKSFKNNFIHRNIKILTKYIFFLIFLFFFCWLAEFIYVIVKNKIS